MSHDKDPLQSLYPFLHGNHKDAVSEREALRESVRQKARQSLQVKQQFFDEQDDALIATAEAVARVYHRQGRLFAMGNGGSSCDAAHLAVEFQHPVTAGRPALPAMNLCIDTAMISAVSNDVGVEHVFVRQLNAHARPGDALVGFSTSGNSSNLMAAFRTARKLGLTTIGFAGGDGGEMAASGVLDHCLVVATDSIHRVQEVHVACYHILWDLVHTLLADQRGRISPNTARDGQGGQPS